VRGLATRLGRSITRFSARIPLRIKLITVALALVAIALAVISAVSVTVFRGYLLHQADRQLERYVERQTSGIFGFPRYSEPGGFVPFLGRPGMSQVTQEVLDKAGARVAGAKGGPAINTDPAWLSAHAGQLVTLPGRSGGTTWRVITEPVYYVFGRTPNVGTGPGTSGGTGSLYYSRSSLGVPEQEPGILVVGVDLGSINATIGTLTVIDLAVSAVVIVILAGVGVALIRASLRPLAEIEHTAGAIAAGDLSRRVPDGDPRTEFGSLARSLNMMLSQIEHAFRARASSEATARHSEERMRRFVADASHELRTPLSVIRGFAEYYRQRGGLREDELDHMIRRVEDEAARMGILVEDLLLLARLDQQRPLQRSPVDLLALAADAVQDARMLAPLRDIQLQIGSGGPFIVLGDEARLRQVIGNLMTNALTHTPDRTPVEVRLRTCRAERGAAPESEAAAGSQDLSGPGRTARNNGAALPGAAARNDGATSPQRPAGKHHAPDEPADTTVVLEVADSGPGLTEQQADRVFERFYRADAARTRKTGGTGLGLAIVAALSAAHGGTVSLDTQPGLGATFRIMLPLAPDAAGLHAARGDGSDGR
jgi:two-component system, OmpR family, sensor kinase